MDARSKLGRKVRKIRQELGVSQESLAELADFDRTYISQVERGLTNISLLNLERLAKALRVRIVDLVSDI